MDSERCLGRGWGEKMPNFGFQSRGNYRINYPCVEQASSKAFLAPSVPAKLHGCTA